MISSTTSTNPSTTAGLYSALSANTSGTASSDGLASLSPSSFLQMLVTEMEDQSPDSPMSSSALMSQVATLTNISDLTQLSQTTTLLGQLAESQSAVSLIGKAVSVTPSSGTSGAIAGTVIGVETGSVAGSPMLELQTSGATDSVSLDNVTAVGSSLSTLSAMADSSS